MAKNTKHRILQAALDKFNESGYFNVRLQHIADAASMSVGNMAYHIQHKVEMFDQLYENWKAKRDLVFADLHLAPIFENFNVYIQQTFELQQEFRFIYIDQLELVRMSEGVRSSYQDYFKKQEEQIEILLTLHEARGALRFREQELQLSALRLRRVIDNWMLQSSIEGKDLFDFLDFRDNIWSEIKPFFTQVGWEEYERLVDKVLLAE